MRLKLSRLFNRDPSPADSNINAQPEATIEDVPINARDPVPLCRHKPSIAQLPDAVIHIILGFLHLARPETLQAVAAVSSSLYGPARYAQQRHVRINLDHAKHGLGRLSLVGRLDFVAAIQVLEVVGSKIPATDDEDHTAVLARLLSMMPLMTGLRSMHWDINDKRPTVNQSGSVYLPIPPEILVALPAATGPHLVRLYTSVCCLRGEESHLQARKFLSGLEGNKNLVSLDIDICYEDERICRETMQSLKRVLLSCPNLDSIPNMDIYPPRTPDYPGGRFLYCGLGFVDGEKPSALKELGMRQYPPWGAQQSVLTPEYPIETPEATYWANTLDWSQLTRLHWTDDCVLARLAPRFTNLRELTLYDQHENDKEPLVDIISPLETLNLLDWSRIGSRLDWFTKFSETLRKLKVHRQELHWNRNGHRFLAASDVLGLSKDLPHVEHLALDIQRDDANNDWPYALLDAIATLRRLRVVELWFPLGREPPAPSPLLTASSAQHLFQYLRGRNESIQRVLLHSGAPVPPHPFPRGTQFLNPSVRGPSWAFQNSVSFECEIVYDAEAADHCQTTVTCLQLGADMNARLGRPVNEAAPREQMSWGEMDADQLRLFAALSGPLGKQEWSSWFNSQPEVIAERAEWKRMHDEIEAFHDSLSLRRRLTRRFRR